jgi:hypothetical protein
MFGYRLDVQNNGISVNEIIVLKKERGVNQCKGVVFIRVIRHATGTIGPNSKLIAA